MNVFDHEVLMTERASYPVKGDIIDGNLHGLTQTSFAQEGSTARSLLKEGARITADITHTETLDTFFRSPRFG